MGLAHQILSGTLTLILKSAWSPAVLFLLAAGFGLVFRWRSVRVPWEALSGGLCALLIASATAYLLTPTLQDDVESGVALVSAAALRDWPIYPSPDAAQRYIVAYGPMTFLAHLPAFWLFGRTLFAFKITGCLAFFASLAGLYRICRHYAPPGPSLVGLGCCSVVFVRYIPVAFWGRSDPLILCFSVLCIWAVLESPAWAAVVVAGVTFGCLPNFKITAGAYLLPILGLIIIRRGMKIAAGAVALGVVLFALPFFSSQVSLSNYWFALNNSRHGISADILLRNIQYSVILLLPVLSVLSYRREIRMALSKGQAAYLTLFVFSVAVTCLVGANIGSGSYHLIPCIVPILDLYFRLSSELPQGARARGWRNPPFSTFAVAWALSLLLMSWVSVQGFLATISHAGVGRQAMAEVRAAESAQMGKGVEVGVGLDFKDFRTVYAALATLDGQPLTVGGLAVRELQVGGFEIPDSTVRYIERCGTGAWLIPRGDAPFSADDDYFDPGHPAFGNQFRRAFLDHYKQTGSGEVFDIWTCAD